MTNLRIAAASDVLVPGQVTRVPIMLTLDEPLKVRGVHATFHGAEETQATYTVYNAATKSTQTHTAVEHVDIVNEEFLLSGNERKGFVGNLADGFATLLGGGDHDVLPAGEYSFEVELQLPSDARPSFTGQKCRVFYELSARVDIPLARDVKALHAFQIVANEQALPTTYTPVRTRYPEDQDTGLLDAWFGPRLRVEVALPQKNYQQGETISGMFTVDSDDPLEFRAITARLICCEATTAQGHTDGFTHQGPPVLIASSGVIGGQYSQQLDVPAFIPGPRQAQGARFDINCFLQLELDVPWAKDPKIRVPLSVW